MAERIQVELVDDIDGSPAQHTVTFALDGVDYEIDLSERHADQLRGIFTRFIERGRRAERAFRETRKQEQEDRRTRRANQQLTEQIRGAAKRTREFLNKTAAEEGSQHSAAEPSSEYSELAPTESPSTYSSISTERFPEKETVDEGQAPIVSLPQFSSAAD